MDGPHTPLTHTEPTRRRDRANSHFCKAVGSRVYCLKYDCGYCGKNDEEDGKQDKGEDGNETEQQNNPETEDEDGK